MATALPVPSYDIAYIYGGDIRAGDRIHEDELSVWANIHAMAVLAKQRTRKCKEEDEQKEVWIPEFVKKQPQRWDGSLRAISLGLPMYVLEHVIQGKRVSDC